MENALPHITIELVALLPLRFEPDVVGDDVPDSHVKDVKASISRQLGHVVRMWHKESGGTVTVNTELQVTHRPIKGIVKHKGEKYEIIAPPLNDLVGHELARKAWCFAVWLPLPDKVQKRTSPFISSDYLGIPTSVDKERRDLNRNRARPALNDELQHWVQNRMRYQMGIPCFPSAHDEDYWETLKEALTPEFTQRFLTMARERIAARNRRAGGLSQQDHRRVHE